MSAARPGEGEGDRETRRVIRQSVTTGTQSADASLTTQPLTRSGFNPLVEAPKEFMNHCVIQLRLDRGFHADKEQFTGNLGESLELCQTTAQG